MTREPSRTTVALIFGGVSSEHEISCLTAGGVAGAIDDRFDVVGVGIDRQGCWRRVPADVLAAMNADDGLPSLPDGLPEAVLLRGSRGAQVATRSGDHLADIRDIDVAFALLHGPFGEDGTIQGLFEMLGVRYVGAGVAASAIGMDKDLMKRELAAAGLPTAPWVSFAAREWDADRADLEASVASLGYPVFVKPARGGSSVGITRVDEPGALEAAVADAARWDPKIVVEHGLIGYHEVEVGVLGGRDGGAPRASVPGEIVIGDPGAFYDFDAKYLPTGEVSLVIPSPLPRAQRDTAADIAKRTFAALGVEGLARVDLFVSPDGHALVNEINTMPGFTSLSMFPMLWAESGLDYADLIAELIGLALARPLGLR